MKKFILMLIIGVCGCLSTFPQATSLTVDNQQAGSLSSIINAEDQKTLVQLKVTGCLNATDMQFIYDLKENKLEVLDLYDVSIVAGGEFTSIYLENHKDNEFNIRWLVGQGKRLRKLITPKTAECITNYSTSCAIDTLILCGTEFEASIGKMTPGGHTQVPVPLCKYLQFSDKTRKIKIDTEGVDTTYGIYGSMDYAYYSGTIVIPYNTIYLGGKLFISGGTIISYVEDPRAITFDFPPYVEYGTNENKVSYKILGGTLYVPKGSTELYKKTILAKLKIIEMDGPSKIQLNKQQIKLYQNETEQLLCSVMPETTFYKDLVWSISNPDVATISQSGILTAINAGTTKLVVRSQYDENISTECDVNVYAHTTGVQMSSTTMIVNLNQECQLSAQTLPLSTSDNELIWSSSDESIAAVDENGKVTGLKLGRCVIKATSVDGGYEAECAITVIKPVEYVSLDKNSISLKVGSTTEITASSMPYDATDKSILWESSNDSIAKVDENGVVTAIKTGTAVITATARTNADAKATCKVTVTQPVTGILLKENTVTLKKPGEAKQLTAIVQPEDASNKNVKWMSSAPEICFVSENGTIVSTGFGTATIIATTVDGGFPAVCIVTVSDKPAYKSGDVNHDGAITMADANAVVNYYLATNKPEDFDVESADVNGDGDITMADANMIVNMFLGGK